VIVVAAVLACLLLAGVAVLQVLLAAGRPLGRFAWGGQHEVLPQTLRIASAASVVVYLGLAAVLLQAAGVLQVLAGDVPQGAIWGLTAFFGLGVVMNGVSRSRPERLVMTPVVLVLALCCLAIALA
jgi:hypothetical protein